MVSTVEEICSSLRGQFRGDLLRPGHAEFREAQRIWNGMVARTPGLIARCNGVADVQAAVRSASASGVFPAVRCGGHSLAGFSSCEGGMVIDLSRMREVRIDVANRRARFGGGCLLGDVDRATQAVGLAFPAGVVSHTGAGGLVLGGGTGWLNRLYGLSCDNVEGFTLVAADGSVLRANTKENPALFWALRGGGGNFGVVTEFEVRLHPLTTVLFGSALHFGDDIARVLRQWRDFMPESPDHLRWGFSLTIAPDAPHIPARMRGLPVASASAVWAGNIEKGRSQVARVLRFSNSVAVSIEEIPFLRLQSMADSEFPRGRRYYTKSGFFQSLTDSSIEIMLESLAAIPSPLNQIELAYLGGAAARVGADETAFGDRSAPFVLNVLGNWLKPEDDAANVGWVRTLFARLRPAMVPGVYVNFMSGDEEERVREAYRNRWERLVAVKSHYDPKNFFCLNQNIPPSAKTAPLDP